MAPFIEQWAGILLGIFVLVDIFLRAKIDTPPDPQTRSLWRRRYLAAVESLRSAGIAANEAGVEQYISLRSEWNQYIQLLAPEFALELEAVDPAVAKVKEFL